MSKLAIITGATRGIGKSISKKLNNLGYSVSLVSRNEKELVELKDELIRNNVNTSIDIYPADLSDKEQIEKYSVHVKENIGLPYILINNVGGYIEEENILGKTLEQMMAINFYAPYYLTQSFIEDFKKNGSGYIFNICSVLSKDIRMNAGAYTISKHSFYAYHKWLLSYLRNYGVKVTALIPGSVNTSSWSEAKNINFDELIQPKDISDAIELCLGLSEHTVIEELTIKPIMFDE